MKDVKWFIIWVDAAEIEGRDCIEDFEKINEELRKFSEKLAGKKQIVIANKMDLIWDMEKFEKFKSYLAEKGIEIYPVSVLLNEGLKEILYKLMICYLILKETWKKKLDITNYWKIKIEKEDFEIHKRWRRCNSCWLEE